MALRADLIHLCLPISHPATLDSVDLQDLVVRHILPMETVYHHVLLILINQDYVQYPAPVALEAPAGLVQALYAHSTCR
jgi:hypothetical protein